MWFSIISVLTLIHAFKWLFCLALRLCVYIHGLSVFMDSMKITVLKIHKFVSNDPIVMVEEIALLNEYLFSWINLTNEIQGNLYSVNIDEATVTFYGL